MEQITNGIDYGTKNKCRVQKHGEVFTPDSIVRDMLKLTTDRIDKTDPWNLIKATYLEPACGNGNFLLRILDTKLNAVQKLSKEKWNFGLVVAISSIYGIDIQDDNVRQSKDRLLELIKNGTTRLLELKDKETAGFNFEKFTLSPELERTITFILDCNIKQGNSLDGMVYTGNGEDTVKTSEQLLFHEYNWDIDNETVLRGIFAFSNLGVCLDKDKCNIQYTKLGNTVHEIEYDDSEDVDF